MTTLSTIAIAMWVHSLQGVPPGQSNGGPKWQKVDQLCGELELAAPTKKSIVVNGKTEIRLYSTPVKNAEVILYNGTATDKTCCGTSVPLARTRSTKFGAFEFCLGPVIPNNLLSENRAAELQSHDNLILGVD